MNSYVNQVLYLGISHLFRFIQWISRVKTDKLQLKMSRQRFIPHRPMDASSSRFTFLKLLRIFSRLELCRSFVHPPRRGHKVTSWRQLVSKLYSDWIIIEIPKIRFPKDLQKPHLFLVQYPQEGLWLKVKEKWKIHKDEIWFPSLNRNWKS